MSEEDAPQSLERDALFYEKMDRALRDLFKKAQAAQELHFAMALMPEFRGMQDGGWSTAEDAVQAYNEYGGLMEQLPKGPLRIRVALALYNHVAESGGLYEVPKKPLLTIEGKGNNSWPFLNLVKGHKLTGERIAPNANRIMQDLAGHAETLGLSELAEVVRDAFDPDVRNAVAHADSVIWQSGLRLRKGNGGQIREIPWPDFEVIFSRGVNLFAALEDIRGEFIQSYASPKTIISQLSNEPPGPCTIFYKDGRFGFRTGPPEPSSAS
jgi:hypothetical protein